MNFLNKVVVLLFLAAPCIVPAQNTTTKAIPKTATTRPATLPAKSTSVANSPQPAAGGGAGKVWVNTDSNVYHCPGTRYYGKTKAGKYMAESQARAAGAKIAKGQNCSK